MKSEKRTMHTVVAASLLGLAAAAFIVVGIHWTHLPHDHRWHGNDADPITGLLSATGVVSAVLAVIFSKSLRSPARELILVGGGLLTMIVVVFGFSIAVSK